MTYDALGRVVEQDKSGSYTQVVWDGLGNKLGLPVQWMGFAIMTGLVFLNAFRSRRVYWSQRKSWVLMALFSIFHFAAGILVVARLAKVGLIDFAAATLLEYFALSAYLDHFMKHGHGYTYFKDGGHTMRTNRYNGQVCYLGSIPDSKSQAAVNPLDEIWNPHPQRPTKLGWVCQ